MNDSDPLEKLYREARTHVFEGRPELAGEALAKLATAMPQNPSVLELQRQAAVVAKPCAAQRSPHALQPREQPAQSSIDLVAFHVDLPRAPSGIHGAIDYMEVLKLSFESARIRAPKARRILLSDEATRVPDSVGADEVVRFAIDPARLMFERMRVQERFLASRAPRRASVLMDSDVVVNRDPCGIFADAFDVGLTWRPEFAHAPFNGGMIFVSEGDAGAAFLRKALACYEALAADAAIAAAFGQDIKAWWGDQFALAALVGFREWAQSSREALLVDSIRVRFFPCSEYNMTLEPGRQYGSQELRTKHFIHFKGNRKSQQAQYLGLMRSGVL